MEPWYLSPGRSRKYGEKGGGNDFTGWKWGNITRLPTNGVDIYVAGVYYFPVSERLLIFPPLLSLSVLPLSFHPSGICVGGIKVVLLSSKLQISFASVHLTLCFITVARGATRFSSPPLQSNNSYQPLFHSSTHYLLHYYYYSILGVGGIIFMALALLGCTAETDRKASSGRMWHATYVMSRDQTDKVVIVALSPPRPGAERADADSASRAPPSWFYFNIPASMRRWVAL